MEASRIWLAGMGQGGKDQVEGTRMFVWFWKECRNFLPVGQGVELTVFGELREEETGRRDKSRDGDGKKQKKQREVKISGLCW